MAYDNSDRRLARRAHEEMVTALFANQESKQQAAIAEWRAQEAEKAERIAAQATPQPLPPSLPSRLKKAYLDKPPAPPRRPVEIDGTG